MGAEDQGLGLDARDTVALYQTIFATTREAVFVVDGDGRCVEANPAASDLLGFPHSELVGMRVGDLVASRPEPRTNGRVPAPGEDPWQGEVHLCHKNGRSVIVEAQSTAVPLVDGTRYVTVARDVAELRQAKLVLQHEAQLVDTLRRIGSTLTAEMDLQQLVQTVTDAATELSGAQFGAFFYNVVNENGEAYTLYTLSGVPREAFANFPMPRNTAVFGPTFKGESVVRLDDVQADPRYGHNPPYNGMPTGHLPVRSYLAAPVLSRTGEVLGGLFFGHQEVGVFSERTEWLVVGIAAQAGIAIDNARLLQSAQRAVQARDEFLSVAAHELRTPLTSLQGTASLALRQLQRSEELDLDRLRRRFDVIVQQGDRLGRLMARLLDVSRIESGRLSIETESADLAQLVRTLVEDYQSRGTKHTFSLHVPASLNVRMDPVRIEQVITNLLENAQKYSPQGGAIDVRLRQADEPGQPEAVLEVQDQGLGIPREQQPHVFERFFQAHRSSHRSGIGLGLYVSRQIMELHGGRIEVDSQEGQGSTFTLHLPLVALGRRARL